MKKRIFKIFIATLFVFFGVIARNSNAFADDSGTSIFALSPMHESLILNPGESYSGSFKATVPLTATMPFNYEVYIQNYYRDENNNPIFEEVNNTGAIADWIVIDSPINGTIYPNGYQTIKYTINVPKDAPAGGQYAVITVGSADKTSVGAEGSIAIQESLAIGYVIYAEIAGETIHQGEIISADVPSFILSGEVSGSAIVKNTGNVHENATYTLQVFPLFSNEEIYTNEETPVSRLVLPDRSLLFTTIWEETPSMGIYNVIYTVNFNGTTQQIKKMVIKCPIWLLFIIIFAVMFAVFWLFAKAKSNKKSKR